ncbi:MAG: GTP pyrophosphokinase [Candidatus Marinimicrobia bacterium]|nr:GTP pyrophosphokinase [Candidatus Neomarinimicrobiota bacterium]
MKNSLNKAIIIAAKIHKGKKGRNQEPAILHPLRVMAMMKDNRSKTVAVLHDVVESGKISIDELLEYGFDKKVCNAIDLLSRKKNQKYLKYIERLEGNKIAKTVKLADLIDNYLKRKQYKKPSKVDLRKIKKYKKAYKILTGEKLKVF